MSIFNNNKNPNYLGPGDWHCIHLLASKATTENTKNCFLFFIKTLSETFYCETCRIHFLEYLKNFPPKKYVNITEGLFLWSFNFHNSVNERLGKQTLLYEEAKLLYYDTKPCLTNCISEINLEENNIKKNKASFFKFEKIENIV